MSPKLQKSVGMLLIIIFSLVELILLMTLSYNVFYQTKEGNGNDAFSSLFVMLLAFFPLKYGLGLWNKGRIRSRPLPDLPAGNFTVSITSTISFPEYQKLVFYLTYSRPVMLFYHTIAITLVILSMVHQNFDILTFLMILIIVMIPISVVVQVRSNYKSQIFLREVCTYNFSSEKLSVSGESFQATHQWQSVYKIVVLNSWVLLYTGQNVALMIPKNSFNNSDEVEGVLSYAQHNGVYVER